MLEGATRKPPFNGLPCPCHLPQADEVLAAANNSVPSSWSCAIVFIFSIVIVVVGDNDDDDDDDDNDDDDDDDDDNDSLILVVTIKSSAHKDDANHSGALFVLLLVFVVVVGVADDAGEMFEKIFDTVAFPLKNFINWIHRTVAKSALY